MRMMAMLTSTARWEHSTLEIMARSASSNTFSQRIRKTSLAQRERSVRLSNITGSKPTSTKANAGKAASPRRSSRASW
jgi:hypothetical protein